MKDRRRAGLVVMALSALFAMGATRPLQPLVQRASQPTGLGPAVCAEGLSDTPGMPRIDVVGVPLPSAMPISAGDAPPSRELRAAVEATQKALERGDRVAFDENRTHVRSMLASYPPGGERRAAEEALATYDDAARVWDEPLFFDESSPAYAAASRYPGYADAVRKQMLVDDRDRRFYPSSETRQFLARAAASRATRLGVKSTTQTAASSRATRPRVETHRPLPSVRARASAATTAAKTTRRARPQLASARRTPAAAFADPSPSSPGRSAAVRVAAADPAPAAPPVVDTSATSAPPAAGIDPPPPAPEPATDTALDTAPAADTAVASDTAPSNAPITATTASHPATDTAPAAATPGRGRSLILPLVLILIGIGVLILLFRAK